MRFAGELAALGTAFCWAAGTNLFASAGRRMGSKVLNRLRITVAALFLGLALLVARGSPWPTWATGSQVALLAVSGLVGFVFRKAITQPPPRPRRAQPPRRPAGCRDRCSPAARAWCTGRPARPAAGHPRESRQPDSAGGRRAASRGRGASQRGNRGPTISLVANDRPSHVCDPPQARNRHARRGGRSRAESRAASRPVDDTPKLGSFADVGAGVAA